MADTTNGTPAPTANGRVPNPTQIYRETQQKREKHRNRKKKAPAVLPLDGTVSDSVMNPTASPAPPRQIKQRQSVANGAAPAQHGPPNGNMAKANAARARPVSLAGPLLPATPAKEQAYAGPTFHASPAPSSLPMPKFFSKSVPNDGGPLQARMEAEKTPERQDSSPEPDIVSPVVRREGVQSPLEMFFKADKEEKQRTRSNGGMLSPEMAARRPMPATEPRNMFQQSGKSIFLREMDGNNEEMPSPRTVPPNTRPPVERAHSSPGVRPQSADEDATKSLKDFLFSSINGTAAQTATPPPQQQRAQSNAQIFNTPSPSQQRPASGPPTPAASTDQPNNYALHYGNRNLSPMFKAARNETPTRPSSLRQELPNGDSAPQPGHSQPPPRHIPQMDSNSFSRGYLDQHIQNSKPVSIPQLPFRPNPPAQASAPSPSTSGSPANNQHNAPRGVSMVSGNSARTIGSRDIGTMEDDLRRILKLNA